MIPEVPPVEKENNDEDEDEAKVEVEECTKWKKEKKVSEKRNKRSIKKQPHTKMAKT